MRSRGRRLPVSRRLMTWLLHSPFADLVDRSIILITVRGMRSGTEYTLPVQFAASERSAPGDGGGDRLVCGHRQKMGPQHRHQGVVGAGAFERSA